MEATTMTTTTLTGYDAIEYAELHEGTTLSMYASPIEDAREGLTEAEARRIAAEDPDLVYCEGVVVTDAEIRALRREAIEDGDIVTAVACDVALDEVEVTSDTDDGEGYPDYSGGGHSAAELARIYEILRGTREAARALCVEYIAS